MLLAVLELAERGALGNNQIRYEQTLEAFADYFEVVRRKPDHCLAYQPFQYLSGDGFWHLHPKSGLELRDRAASHKSIMESIEHASLDPELHRLLHDPHARARLREALIDEWFFKRRDARCRDALLDLIAQRRVPNEYEHELRQPEHLRPRVVPADQAVRDPAFRRLVLEAYDYRCAASGWRLFIPDGPVLTEAAHLIPFSKSRDDRPQNGIALTPTYHRALDAHLIAPGPDMKWRVSDVLDRRIPDNAPLLDLAGEDVIFHGSRRYRPRKDALEWRVERLRARPE